MSARKGNDRIRMAIVQFHYEHRKLEGRMEKIRKNAAELGRFLDSMPPKKGEKEEKAEGEVNRQNMEPWVMNLEQYCVLSMKSVMLSQSMYVWAILN